MKTLLPVGLALFLVFTSLASLARADDVPAITAHLKCLSIGGPLSDVDLLQPSGVRIPLKIASSCISLASTYQGPATLIFVRHTATTPAPSPYSGAPAAKPVVLATVTIPPPGGDYLLLFSGDTSAKLQVIAVPFSAAAVPDGSCLVWNTTSRNLGLIFGDNRVLMSPSQHQLVKPVTRVNNYCDLRIFDEHDGKVRPLVSGPHFLSETSRQLLFIVERTPGQAAIMVRTIEELPPAPRQQQVAANP